MVYMLLLRAAIDENVIKKYCNELAKIRLEKLIHCRLEGLGCVCKSEGHDFKLVVA